MSSEKRPTVFTFVNGGIRPGDSTVALALDDDYSFGVLHSALQRAWFEPRCSPLETRLRSTSSTVFDSFPWPQAPAPARVKAIESVVERLLEVRAEKLAAGMSLARQYDTLRQPGKNLLRSLHAELDAAVTAAYGFDADEDPPGAAARAQPGPCGRP